MSGHAIIFKLSTDEDWAGWRQFKDMYKLRSTTTYNDRPFTNIIYKSYRIEYDEDLSYILLKWDVVYKGDFDKWREQYKEILMSTEYEVHWD